jgi:hypothetical protein
MSYLDPRMSYVRRSKEFEECRVTIELNRLRDEDIIKNLLKVGWKVLEEDCDIRVNGFETILGKLVLGIV